MKIENRKSKINQGFTLIELLIVITLLGILAVAVLSAINPIEQINRSRDTSSRSDAEQLINAIDRYYATAGFYPWRTSATDEGAGGSVGVDWTAANESWTDTSTESVVLDKLSSGGYAELKESFINRISGSTYNTLYVYNRGQQGDSTYVCFDPASAAFLEEAETRCNINVEEAEQEPLPDDFPSDEACGETVYSCLP